MPFADRQQSKGIAVSFRFSSYLTSSQLSYLQSHYNILDIFIFPIPLHCAIYQTPQIVSWLIFYFAELLCRGYVVSSDSYYAYLIHHRYISLRSTVAIAINESK